MCVCRVRTRNTRAAWTWTCRNTKSGEKTPERVCVPYREALAAASSPPPVKRSPERRRGSSKKARIGARHCSGRPRVNRKGWLTAPKQTQSSRRGTAAATPAAAATLFASRAGRRCRSCGGRRTSSLMGRCGLCGTPGSVATNASPHLCVRSRALYILAKSWAPCTPRRTTLRMGKPAQCCT